MALRLAGKVVLDADETNVGQAIARARQATSLLAAAIQEARVVASDAGLERAKALLNDELLPELKSLERDNDCVYMERVPKVEDLPPLAAAKLGQGDRTAGGRIFTRRRDAFPKHRSR